MASASGHPIAQSARLPAGFVDERVSEVVRRQAPAKPQLDAPDAKKTAANETVGADSRVPDLVFDHVEFTDRQCVDSAKGAPRSAICSSSAVALASAPRGCRIEREQVSLRLDAHRSASSRGGKDERAW